MGMMVLVDRVFRQEKSVRGLKFLFKIEESVFYYI